MRAASRCGLLDPVPPGCPRCPRTAAAGLTGPLLFREMFFHSSSCSWWRKPILAALSSAAHASILPVASGGDIPSEPVPVRTLVTAGQTLLSSVVSSRDCCSWFLLSLPTSSSSSRLASLRLLSASRAGNKCGVEFSRIIACASGLPFQS